MNSAFATIVCVSFATVLLSGCIENLCSNEVLSETRSPNNKQVATVFERNCGATAPFVRVVALHGADMPIEFEKVDNWIYSAEGRPEIKLAWNTDQELTVQIIGQRKSNTQLKEWDGVSISYR